ncbi:phosphoribosylamine--glycine ligase [Alkaliphilus crotonatoxidans]
MKILVIGGGGREHALVWKLKQSPLITDIYCAPGNPGIARLAKCVNINPEEIMSLVEFSREIGIDMTIVGPELPLVSGIVDSFRSAGLNIIGPTAHGARLEGSKAFSKEFMERYKIPTAKYKKVSSLQGGLEALKDFSLPVVVKADGLAAGKGVIICQSQEEAQGALEDILTRKIFGQAGQQVVLEEFLEGTETSILCFVDGKTIVPMVSSQDHKRIYDGDQGPNTGGMGTYSPSYSYTQEVAKQVEKAILIPTLKGIQAERMDFRGILFVGLMLTTKGPKVLEYNVRFGDPETQVVIPRLKTDLVVIFQHMLQDRLNELPIQWHETAAVCVVLASGGYPKEYQKGLPIEMVEDEEDLVVFHAGTQLKDGCLVTNGGRVLGITALGETIETARKKAYGAVEKIKFNGKIYRKDIALK